MPANGDYMYKYLALLAIAWVARAQDYPKNSFEVGAGAGIPVFARSRGLWDDSAQFSAGYGFRFNRHFQADLMYTRVFNPAETQFEEFVLIEGHKLGGGSIDSYLFGGRVLFPVRSRVLLSAGAGAIYDRFNAPRLSLGLNLDQTGWGAYLLGSASVPLGRSKHFYLAVTPRLEVVQARYAWYPPKPLVYVAGSARV
jgi:hypothetical protein